MTDLFTTNLFAQHPHTQDTAPDPSASVLSAGCANYEKTDPAALVQLSERLTAVNDRLIRAAHNCGRAREEISLELAVKTRSAQECIWAATALEQKNLPIILGHNRVQEAAATSADVRAGSSAKTQMHLIGHLQSNKVNAALRLFDVIETVDSRELAQALSKRCQNYGRELAIFLQVNTSGEASKSGCAPAAAAALAYEIAQYPQLHLRGFMTVGAPGPDPQVIANSYACLRELRDQITASGKPGCADAVQLSMGMSADLEIAVSQGATIVRIGTDVFGPRRPI